MFASLPRIGDCVGKSRSEYYRITRVIHCTRRKATGLMTGDLQPYLVVEAE